MKRNLSVGALLTALAIVAAVASVVVSGCAGLPLNIENPRYSIRDIRPRVDIALPLSASTIDINFNLEVDNPNPVGLRLDQLDFNLFVNDTRLLESTRAYNVNIAANDRSNVQLETRIGYQNLRSMWDQVVNWIRGERGTKYELRGTAYYNTPLGRLKFPVTVYSTR